jgi:hypothetical protein
MNSIHLHARSYGRCDAATEENVSARPRAFDHSAGPQHSLTDRLTNGYTLGNGATEVLAVHVARDVVTRRLWVLYHCLASEQINRPISPSCLMTPRQHLNWVILPPHQPLPISTVAGPI